MKQSIISRAIKVDNLIFLSGLTGNGSDTETQSRNIFEKIKTTLQHAGSSMENVINATVYLADLDDKLKKFNPIWSEYFPENPPTRTCIQVGLTPNKKVEITVVAKISEES